jgi:hypothetical protein
MSPRSKREYFKRIWLRYRKASRKEKTRILDEFCLNCSCNRKYAIRRLNRFRISEGLKPRKRPGPSSKYHLPELIKVLREIWIGAHLPCSKRLKALLPFWIGPYQLQYGTLSLDILKKLGRISPSTLDRILKPIRHLYQGKGRSATKPGLLLKHHIPIKTNQWDETIPGFLETDSVAHCGTSLEGIFVNSVNTVDIATGWTEQRAVWGKGHREVYEQIRDMEKALPFQILGFDCDNGGEFLNHVLMKYFLNRPSPVQFTRSRAYQKNDNAHVEGKNWTHVRQWLGYRRFENPRIAELLNDLYKNEWRLFHNFFLPSVKLKSKLRIGSKIIKYHDSPKTPYQRLIDSKLISEKIKATLRKTFESLNPFKLREIIDEKIARIHQLAR